MTRSRAGNWLLPLGWGALLLGACDSTTDPTPVTSSAGPAVTASTATTALPSATVASSAAASAAASSTAATSQHPPARTDGCPEGMVRVEGDYCPAVRHVCEEHHHEYRKNKRASERCLSYRKPSQCLSKKRRPMSFCMDRYEYPNRVGELPWVLTSWHQAKARCEEQGKRLCTPDEFNFACEGPELLPQVYGYRRSKDQCHIDAPYVQPDHSRRLLTYEKCLKNERCRKELERLDQRHAIGSRLTCVSWAGVVDLNGNVNEWVEIPGEEPPNRSGLKGGWWGPVRCRCRPMVTFHKESDYGYEVGFRCCQDTAGAANP